MPDNINTPHAPDPADAAADSLDLIALALVRIIGRESMRLRGQPETPEIRRQCGQAVEALQRGCPELYAALAGTIGSTRERFLRAGSGAAS